jgi:hypothetical protein
MRLTAFASGLPNLSRVRLSRVKMPNYRFIRARPLLPDQKTESGSRKPL